MVLGIILAIIAACLASYSQILLKKSSMLKVSSKLEEYTNKYVILGYFLMGLASVLNVIAYMQIDFMLGNILNSLTYILVIIFAYYFFEEKISGYKAVGMICIILGVVSYSI